MIIFENLTYQFNSDYPDSKYDENAIYYAPDGSELAYKYTNAFDKGYDITVIAEDDGLITDVIIDKESSAIIAQKQEYILKIAELKNELNSEDYKIIKCYECFMIGAEAPYDIQALIAKRNSIRNEINYLETLI